MSPYICRSCRAVLRQKRTYSASSAIPVPSATTKPLTRKIVSLRTHFDLAPTQHMINVDKLLSADYPSWSVTSLLPTSKALEDATLKSPITAKLLHHLLKLSALPLPRSEKEETEMIKTLQTQLHFVRAIREVDTQMVEPLVQIRDETVEGQEEITIDLDSLKKALANEVIVGKNGRPRRTQKEKAARAQEIATKSKNATRLPKQWDVLSTAAQKVGRYFVVRSGKLSATATKKPPRPLVQYHKVKGKAAESKVKMDNKDADKLPLMSAGDPNNSDSPFRRDTPSHRGALMNLKLAAQ